MAGLAETGSRSGGIRTIEESNNPSPEDSSVVDAGTLSGEKEEKEEVEQVASGDGVPGSDDEKQRHAEDSARAATAADVPPDGGYGWVVIACLFFQNATTWGVNTAFGVFLSFYRKVDFFPGATDTQYAFIGGLSISLALFSAPLSNYLTRRFGFKTPMCIGLAIYIAGQLLAAFSKKIWQLILTQGVLCGLGMGLLYCASIPLPQQWFLKKRALALGIATAGSGAGALVLSITTRLAIQHISLRWAFIINALIEVTILVPVIILLKSRVKATGSKFTPFKFQLLWHPGFVYIWVWGCVNVLGYIIALYSLPTYATTGLNLTQAQGSNVQAILAAGQMIGRPLCGLSLDKFGRINGAAFYTFMAGLSCLVIWLPARSYGVLIFFAIIQGLFGGIIWSASAAVTVDVIGIQELGSALSILWIMVSIPSTFAEPIAVWLLEYSRTHLHRSGADEYLISVGFAGATFCASALILLGAKRHKQGHWGLLTKS
ncbi:MFS general substrate transporter [Sistotremastrum suecicum HHB10207 ss-3]|uniref:MFS general substrate transporter n=1 Tax=Sistotremastrum suecicum HHB10207 ss-3 TaxID=1314776 RepID=A0A165Y3H9_9AGAM|nr:MFS general substrate transporter [Sistotremastrum suecicum HHB10207 ss-3]